MSDSTGPADLRLATGGLVTDREVVAVTGPDAATFLQGQISADVTGLAVGDSAWTFILHPDGKVAVWARVSRVADDRFVFDVDGGHADTLLARLERFKMRVACTIEVLDWHVVALRGPDSVGVAVDPGAADVLSVDPAWPGVVGVDLLGPTATATVPEGVPVCGVDAYEALRIEAGVPRMGAELTDRTIPAEAGVVERSVSFTKGCFTGQELVARIDSRGGNVPRHLRGLVVTGDVVPPAGAEVVVEGKVVGTVTSAASSAALGAPVALAYVGRSVAPPSSASVRWDDSSGVVSVAADIRELPLVP